MRRNLRWFVPCLLLVLLIGGCSCRTHPSVSGSLDSGVVFTFEKMQTVRDAGVATRDPSGQWQTIWAVTGKDRIETLRYGEVRRKLQTRVAAGKLERGKVYEFGVDTDRGWLTRCGGHVRFMVMADGSIEQCSNDVAAATSCR